MSLACMLQSPWPLRRMPILKVGCAGSAVPYHAAWLSYPNVCSAITDCDSHCASSSVAYVPRPPAGVGQPFLEFPVIKLPRAVLGKAAVCSPRRVVPCDIPLFQMAVCSSCTSVSCQCHCTRAFHSTSQMPGHPAGAGQPCLGLPAMELPRAVLGNAARLCIIFVQCAPIHPRFLHNHRRPLLLCEGNGAWAYCVIHNM